MSLLKTSIQTGSVLALLAAPGWAEEYRASNWMQHNHPISQVGYAEWVDRIKEASDGELTFQNFEDGVLIAALPTLEGIGDGVAEVGYVTFSYTPSLAPVAVSVGMVGFDTPDAYVLAGAYADFMMNDPAALQEAKDKNVVYGGGMTTPPYYFICREPWHTAAELKGKRVRTPSPGLANLVEYLGGTSVSLPGPEIYEGFDRGTVDCTVGDLGHIIYGANLKEVAHGIIDLPMGPYYTSSLHVYNRDFWQGISDKNRRAILDVEAYSLADLEVRYMAQAEESKQAGVDFGIPVLEPDDALKQEVQNWIAGGMNMVADAEALGLKDSQAIFDRFRGYVDKWKGIIAGMKDRSDTEELAALYREHIYDKIDETTFAMD